MSEDLDDDDDLAMADAWRDYQADLLRPTGVDDPDAVAEAIWLGDLVLIPAEDLAERTADASRLASLLEKLRPYLCHSEVCEVVEDMPCTCPLSALLAEIGDEK